MAYTEKARELRRCIAYRRYGEPCRAWATWEDPLQRCNVHAGRHTRGPWTETAKQKRQARAFDRGGVAVADRVAPIHA
jgi:hypothetical protein